MKTIGITGGIGSGKSTIAKLFISLGIPCYNSDLRAKELIDSNPEIISTLKKIFGEDIYLNHSLDRKKMASIVFNNPEKLTQLNNIVHPVVANDFQLWRTKQNSAFVIKEAAIIFEMGIYKELHKTILVTAPEKIRIERVMKRDKSTKKAVLSRIKNQWKEEDKIKLADFVVDNSGNRLVVPQVLEIIKKIR